MDHLSPSEIGQLIGGSGVLIAAVAWAIREFGKLYVETIRRLANRVKAVEEALTRCHEEREEARAEAATARDESQEARAAAEQALGTAMLLRDWAVSHGYMLPSEPVVPPRMRLPSKTPTERPAMTAEMLEQYAKERT